MSTKRLSTSLSLLFTKGQTQRGNSNNVTERKSKEVNVNGVNYDAKMDLGTMTFTSSVSLFQKTVSNYARRTNYSWAIDRIINAQQC